MRLSRLALDRKQLTATRILGLALILLSPRIVNAQFTRTYNFPGSLDLSTGAYNSSCGCVAPYNYGFTNTIQDSSLSGKNLQITSIAITGTVTANMPDINGIADFDWDVYIGPSPFGFPSGQITGSSTPPGPMSTTSTAPTQLQVSLANPASSGQTIGFGSAYNFTTGQFTTGNSSYNLKAAIRAPMNVTNGLYIQVFAWTEAVDINLTLSNIQVVLNGTGNGGCPSISLSLKAAATSMFAQFSPVSDDGTPISLALAAADCNFAQFDWQQTIDYLPAISCNFAGQLNPACPTTYNLSSTLVAPPAFNDPPNGGYNYFGDYTKYPVFQGAYPYYYALPSVPGGCAIEYQDGSCETYITSPDGRTLSFFDSPNDIFLPVGSYVGFTTNLVGVLQDGSVGPALYSWSWLTTYRSGTGGVQFSSVVSAPGGGVGGISITSINGVQLPPVVSPSQIATTTSGLAYSRVSQTFNGTVTLTNISGSAINGPLQIVFFGMPANVTLANATSNLSGTPYLTVPAVVSLAPGQSATVNVQFKNPSNATLNLTPVIYSGSIN